MSFNYITLTYSTVIMIVTLIASVVLLGSLVAFVFFAGANRNKNPKQNDGAEYEKQE